MLEHVEEDTEEIVRVLVKIAGPAGGGTIECVEMERTR